MKERIDNFISRFVASENWTDAGKELDNIINSEDDR